MQKYVFAYHGGPKSISPEEGQAHMADWLAWMEGLGEAVIDRGLAVGNSRTASSTGIVENGGSNPLSGYSVIQAADMDTALKMASESPHITVGGTIEVAPVMDMSM